MKTQVRQALERANEVRLTRARERRALRGQPPEVIAEAIRNPSEALASYTLGDLFLIKPRIIARFSYLHFNRVVDWFHWCRRNGRIIDTETKLRDLTDPEREILADCVVEFGPERWRQAA